MRRAPLALLLTMALSAGFSSLAARAQEGFNPFAAPETSRPKPKPAAEADRPPEPRKPLLAPMDGRIPEGGPWSAAPQPPTAPGQYGTPYAPPSGAPSAPGEPPGGTHAPAPSLPPPRQEAIAREPLPAGPAPAPPQGPAANGIERGELAPVMAGDGSGLPYELWRGLTVAAIEALFASLEIPPRSPALHELWMRLITAEAGSPTGGEQDQRMLALRAEALDRSGAPRAARDLLAKRAQAADPVAQLIEARTSLELGERDSGCAAAKALAGSTAEMPKRLKGEAIVLAGYCAAATGNAAGAGIAAELARENGVDDASGPAMLDTLAAGSKPELPKGRRIGLVEFGMMELAGGADRALVMAGATPSLLAFLARDARAEPGMRLAAAEAAAAVNAIKPADLAGIYRADAPAADDGGGLAALDAAAGELAPRRAALFKAIEAERTPQKKSRQIRAFLDSARRAQLYWPALEAVAEAARTLEPAPEISWFAETAVEIALAERDHDRARSWIALAAQSNAPQGNLDHWLALADIASAADGSGRAAHLDSVERLALNGRFDPVLLHRLATVLDALGTHIPVPLWEAASRTPQPAGGHLPDTGALTALLEASKRKEFGHTVLLAMQALGPTGAEGAHLIALGDSIRALKRAGLDAEARALSLEALFAGWPRAGT